MKKLFVSTLSTLFTIVCYAQPKIKSLSEMDTAVKEGAASGTKWVMYIIGFILALGAVYSIYAWITNQQNKGSFAIGFGVGILIWLITYNYIIGF